MIKEISHLSEDEQSLLYKAPVWVAILIAGADSKFDKKEIKAAITASKWHPGLSDSPLAIFYQELSRHFEVDLKGYIALMPKEVSQRTELIIDELKKLNNVLPKLDKKFAIRYYESLKGIAKKVAGSSGGIFGVLNVGPEERKHVNLRMINNPSEYH